MFFFVTVTKRGGLLGDCGKRKGDSSTHLTQYDSFRRGGGREGLGDYWRWSEAAAVGQFAHRTTK